MRESEKAEVFNQAIDLLVAEAVVAAKPKSPGAYGATVRADLSQRHRLTARALYAEHGDLHAEHLALLLSAADKPEPEPHSPAAALPTVTAATFHTGPSTPKAKAKERVAAIKEQLQTVTKQPIPERTR